MIPATKQNDILDSGIRLLCSEKYISHRQMMLIYRVWQKSSMKKKRFSRAELRRICK